jgi:hypothetical protein
MSTRLKQWKALARRALAMSPKELADRLQQQATARLDFLRYKAGIGFEPRLAEDVSSAEHPQFFFAQDEIPPLCSLLRELFPNEMNELVERAERICRHRFDLLGYKDLDYGDEIDWHTDRVHGKRAPRKVAFQTRYLDFKEVGDSKVTWELNRHQHLVTLAKAYRLTGNEKFATEIFRQWNHWHRENPYPIGINWASSLEVAFRSLSWLWVYFLMTGSPAMPDGFRVDLVRKLAVSGRHIESYLSTYFSPNTHLLGEGVALFFIRTLCPELRHAERWRQRGWDIVQNEAARQVRDDGFHFEQSTYYHVYALDFFLHSMVLASRNGVPVPDVFKQKVERMLDAVCLLGRAGPVPKFGDDDGGRLFDPQRNRTELLDPLATGAALFRRGDFKAVAGGLREETVWLLGEAGVNEFNRLPMAPVASHSAELSHTGLYVISDDNLDRQLVVDAGPQGADSAGHGHADALSIVANVGGRALLIDSGTFEYVGPGPERNHFRGSRAHNTMVVDGLDQSAPAKTFSWGNLTNARAECWIKGETFDFFVGSHDGYTRLAQPVLHRRLIFFRKNRFWFVRDLALGQGTHQLDVYWHIAPELLPVESHMGAFRGADVGLSIVASENHGWSQEVLTENWSPAYGQRQPHSVLHFGTRTNLPAELAVLLVPHLKTDEAVENFVDANLSSESESAVCYRFKTAEEQHCVIFAQSKPWMQSVFSSDAEFLYWSQNHENMESTLICCDGSYVEIDGRRVISSPQTFSRCEVITSKGKVHMISDLENVKLNEEVFRTISLQTPETRAGR